MCVDRGWCHHKLKFIFIYFFHDGKILFQSGWTMINEGMLFSLVCCVVCVGLCCVVCVCVCVYS